MTIWIMPDFDRERAVCDEAPTEKKSARAPMQNLRTPHSFRGERHQQDPKLTE